MNHEYNQRVDKRLDSVLILRDVCNVTKLDLHFAHV